MAWLFVYGMDEDLEEGPHSSRELVKEPLQDENRIYWSSQILLNLGLLSHVARDFFQWAYLHDDRECEL